VSPTVGSYRYASLDQWRGAASLWVMMFHSFAPLSSSQDSLHHFISPLASTSAGGWFGVHMFFVVSGYCVSAKALEMVLLKQSAASFLGDRLFRIFPTYWAACLLSILLALVFSPFSHGDLSESLPKGWFEALTHFLLAEPYFGFSPLLVVSWSLVYEIGFYVIVGLGMVLVLRLGNWWAAIGLGILGALAGIAGAGDVNLIRVLRFWPEFLCGISVFLFVFEKQKRQRREWLWALLPIMISIVAFTVNGTKWFDSTLDGVVIFSLLLMFLHQFDEHIASLRFLRWLAWFGGISYSLYLVHVPVGSRLMNAGLRLTSGSEGSAIFLVLSYWGGSVLGAFIFFRLIESRFERIRKRLIPRSKAPFPPDQNVV